MRAAGAGDRGDYYDFPPLGGESLAWSSGTFREKAWCWPAFMAMAKATVRAVCEGQDRPQEIIRLVNKQLCHYMDGRQFMTMLFMRWDPGKE